MKSIINNKLYDTENAEMLCDIELFHDSIWITKKGELFLVNNTLECVSGVNQEELKELLGKENAEKYIELYGAVEEA